MSYRLILSDSAIKDLSRLDTHLSDHVLNKLAALAEECDRASHRALTGPWKGLFRLRIGDYRAMYTIDREPRELRVDKVRHRSQLYKDLA